MSHRIARPRLRRTPLLLTAALMTAPAHAGWFAGFDFGSAAMSETGSFGAPVGGFGGPTVDADLCGGTATITVGAEPTVGEFEGRSTAYGLFLGWRQDAWSVEVGAFNVSRYDESASAGPYAVAQPTCNPVPTDPITVSARGVKLEKLSFDGFTITPAYSWGFADRWTLDLRAKVAFWQADIDSQWGIELTELVAGDPLQSYTTAVARGDGTASGTDLWPGLGLSWEASDGVRVRGLVERQAFDELKTTAWSVGIAIDIP